MRKLLKVKACRGIFRQRIFVILFLVCAGAVTCIIRMHLHAVRHSVAWHSHHQSSLQLQAAAAHHRLDARAARPAPGTLPAAKEEEPLDEREEDAAEQEKVAAGLPKERDAAAKEGKAASEKAVEEAKDVEEEKEAAKDVEKEAAKDVEEEKDTGAKEVEEMKRDFAGKEVNEDAADDDEEERERKKEDWEIEAELEELQQAKAKSTAKSKIPRPQTLYPFPINFKIVGKEIKTILCDQDNQHLRDDCCAKACSSMASCVAYSRFAKVRPSPCRLMAAGKASFNKKEIWNLGRFKGEIPIEVLLPEKPGLLQRLEKELELTCPLPSPSSREGAAALNFSEVEKWLASAKTKPNSCHKIFWEHGFALSTKMCHNPRAEERTARSPAWTTIVDDEDSEAEDVKELADKLDTRMEENRQAFKLILKPGCPVLHGGGQWYRGLVKAKSATSEEIRSTYQAAENHSFAFLNADMWSNVGHSLQHLMWLDWVLRNHRLPVDNLGIVATGMTYFNPVRKLVLEVMKAWTPLWPAPAAAAIWADNERKVSKSKVKPPARCFEAIAQRIARYPLHPWQYTFRERMLEHCKLKDTGMKKRVVVHYKQAWHRQFVHMDWVQKVMKDWAKQNGLRIDFATWEMAEGEVVPCEQVALLSSAAIYIFVHGAGGMQVLWMPKEAVVIEVDIDSDEGDRLTNSGYYAEMASAGGQLYTRFRRVLPLLGTQLPPKWLEEPNYLTLDWERDLIPVLDVLWNKWLISRVS